MAIWELSLERRRRKLYLPWMSLLASSQPPPPTPSAAPENSVVSGLSPPSPSFLSALLYATRQLRSTYTRPLYSTRNRFTVKNAVYMSLSQITDGCHSFSFIMTSGDGTQIALKDLQPAKSRRIRFGNLPNPRAGAPQPSDDDPKMRTIDTRYEGDLVYDVVYGSESLRRKRELEEDERSGADEKDFDFEDRRPPVHERFFAAFWAILRGVRKMFSCTK
ncbi:hypothetical protein CC1G_01832 [Coprinopsis cinerea okayama7|uniref:Uncharacterized protein n=1 Tax=Coprinopsis cinerea (strain Okayama-7 / 130 / ATCC MYA-4618 / FGSC 9003) TaxID=240176 RepID=A8N2T0_COPC7|nr:hypothetical protein CC1G_01832 [Coprinopsis cinerea okayama7\|eukprot:XP_001829152.2 hypothetical protein CC1G_01832 [Coprinopsis cinerea okayama7\